jgi:cell division protein FtsN
VPAKQASPPVRREAFFVQVASFQNTEDADRQAARLKSKGYKVVIIKADIPGKGTWYRVRLGPYRDSADAKSVALKYEKKEKSTTFVTKGLI